MAIEIKWKDGETVKTSTISNDKILSTKMVSGKNQPFGAVEATFDRYIFSSEYKDDNWDSTSNPLPNITLGESKMSVDTFGSVTDYIITSVSNDEDYTVVTAHHPAYTLTHTYFNSLFLNIYTVYQTFDDFTRFSVNLPGWSDANFTSDAPNDWYRAQSNKGCSYKYSSTLKSGSESGSGHPGSYYESPQKMYNISRYASGVGYYGGKEGYEEVAKKKHTVWYTYRDINLILHISLETVGGKNIRSIEWVEGETEDIVRFIIMMGVSDNVYPQTFSPPMTYYPDFDSDTGLIGADPKKEYTENELNKAMSKGLVNLNQESYASYDFGTSIGSGLSTSRIRLRVNGTSTCKSILDAIGSFTNRKYHFSSEGFFMTNNVPDSDAKQYFVKDGTFGHRKVTINTHKVVYLDMDTSSKYEGVEAEMTSTAPDIIDNTDAVVISSQTVYGENYSWKTSNISSSASKEGSKILFPIVDMSDDNTEGINSYRNRMLGLCAYNELVNRYRYENSIVYSTSEIDAVPKIEWGTLITDYDEFLRETGQLYVSGDTSTHPTENYPVGHTILFDDGIVMEKVEKIKAGISDCWEETTLYKLSSSYKYSADSCTELLKDNYNGFELNNVPLAFLIRSYPEHLTTLAWGKSHTNDLPEQLREQQEDIMINGSPGDEDAEISNKYSSRLVVGNLTQSQLAEQDDVKNGFTGLIMEKNVGAELYRLAGYDNGVVQAMFDTDGKIVAGEGKTTLDENGLTVLFDGNYNDITFEPQSALKFKCVQDPNWESASLFSSMLKVNMPGMAQTRENLTALTLNNGPAPDNIKSNLLLSTSDSGYGAESSTSYIYPRDEPHCIFLRNSEPALTVFFPNDTIIDSNSDLVYIGYNPQIMPNEYFDTWEGDSLVSGFKIRFTITLNTPNPTVWSKISYNKISFYMGSKFVEIPLDGVTPQYQSIQFTYTLKGVFPCEGPYSLELKWSDGGTGANASITTWAIGIFGCLTVSSPSMGIEMSQEVENLIVDKVKWGGEIYDLHTNKSINISHTLDTPIYLQLATDKYTFSGFPIDKGEIKNISVPYDSSYYGRCTTEYDNAYNKTVRDVLKSASENMGTLEFTSTSIVGRGSMIFLRDEGAYIFGEVNISGGQHANISFKQPYTTEKNTTDPGGIFLKNSLIRGRYTSDGLPEASALKQIGSMMRVSVDDNVSQKSVYRNKTDYPIYVILVHHHHWLEVHLTDTNGKKMLIHQSDGDGGLKSKTGKSTASFFVPPGWAWDCEGASAHKYATTFYFVEEGM